MLKGGKRTGTLGRGMVDCPSSVTRFALGNAVSRTRSTGLHHAVVAGANIAYKITTQAKGRQTEFLLPMNASIRERTNALGAGMVDCPSDIACLAFRNAVHRTRGTGLRHAVIAYANVRCVIAIRKQNVEIKLSSSVCSGTLRTYECICSRRG